MPSLQQLNEFKASFRNIGDELTVLAAQNMPYDDLDLPDSEPVSQPPQDLQDQENDSPEGLDLGGLEDFSSEEKSAGDQSLPEDFGESPLEDENPIDDIIGGLTFDDFLNTMPEDLPPPPVEAEPDAQASGEGDDAFTFPEDPLSGPADDLGEAEDQEVPFSDDAFGDFASEDFASSLNFEEPPKDEGGFGEDSFFNEDFQDPLPDLNAESGDEGGDVPNLDFSEEDDFSLPEDKPEADAEEGLKDSDSFDRFNLEDGGSPDFDSDADNQESQEVTETDGNLSDLDDFSLPGIDDIFNKAAAAAADTPSPAVEGRQAGKAAAKASPAAPPAPKKLEDITFSEEDLARFQENLSLYPLNLRVACEEIIAERTVPIEQMDALIKLILRGAAPRETASLAGKILNRFIPIPKGYAKKTGAALEVEQDTLAYAFSRKFLPLLRTFLIVALLGASLVYLAWQFIYLPIHSESIYRRGYERIAAGEYERANERFNEAFALRRVKQWFYRYAEAFRDERQYIYAEEKYDELLRYYPRDKKGALDYADLETSYLRNYSKADRIITTHILNYNVEDQDGLLALGDNNLAWGEVDPSRYENARQAYARLLERYGWQDPIVERMLLYFIRTDNLGEVIPLQQYLTGDSKKKVSPAILSELGGYLLDKQIEDIQGVPDANIERIEGVRNILIRASQSDPSLPEPQYHLARYYNRFGNVPEERQTLESALRAFDAAREESPRRTAYRIDAERRYAQALTNAREFFSAEERLVKGIGIYEDALNRRLLSRSPEYGRLYADLGDLEYFTKSRDMNLAAEYYLRAESNGWAPPEVQYRIGAAYYHLGQWKEALERFFTASSELPLNRRLLHALGNASYMQGSYSIAEGYYRRLLDLLETERARFPLLSPTERPDHMELAERLMVARNNTGVTLEALTDRTGNPRYRSEAQALYAESARAWDTLTRNPDTMIRSAGTNLGFLNSRNILHPQAGYEPQLFNQIDKDVLEPSAWEALAPPDYRLSD
ncbi:MAG: tetratricopeptide repeat protein [Treponema sp.]|jgi:tetratricopeptide (TPR) repeat protein|nr:tetratricopeptide repeat protein [Treponema sp.]